MGGRGEAFCIGLVRDFFYGVSPGLTRKRRDELCNSATVDTRREKEIRVMVLPRMKQKKVDKRKEEKLGTYFFPVVGGVHETSIVLSGAIASSTLTTGKGGPFECRVP